MSIDQLITQLLGQGPMGLVAGISCWVAYKKDQELKSVYRAVMQREQQRAEQDRHTLRELSQVLQDLAGPSGNDRVDPPQ